jgi:hypothetical protein
MEKVKIHIISHSLMKKMNNKNKTITQKIKLMGWGIKILKMDH